VIGCGAGAPASDLSDDALPRGIQLEYQLLDETHGLHVLTLTTLALAEPPPQDDQGEADASQHDCARFEELIDQFEKTEDPIRHQMATVMLSFLAGLFVGDGLVALAWLPCAVLASPLRDSIGL
jgi:hypothetical protein